MDVTYRVRRWYSIDEDGIERLRVAVSEYLDESAAQAAYETALRRRWLPDGALDSGVEVEGFRPASAGAVRGPREAIERLRRTGDLDGAEALERLLDRGAERREESAA